MRGKDNGNGKFYSRIEAKHQCNESGDRILFAAENAFTEFMATKTAHHKKGGMNFYHYVQSFSPSESVTAEQVHEIGLAFAKKAWPGHEVLATTHTDVAHLHNHFVINSVHYENGVYLLYGFAEKIIHPTHREI